MPHATAQRPGCVLPSHGRTMGAGGATEACTRSLAIAVAANEDTFRSEIMELLNCEQRARSFGGCAGFLFVLFLCGGFSFFTLFIFLPDWAARLAGTVVGTIAAFLLFACLGFIYSFVRNDVWRFGIRDDVIWWDSPRWPRSAGVIPLDDVSKVTIYEGTNKLRVTMRDGTTRRIPCFAAAKNLRAIFHEHYPSVAVEFIKSAD